MSLKMRWFGMFLLAAASVAWLSGCGGGGGKGTPSGPKDSKSDHKDHKDGDHKDKAHKDGDHHDKALTAKDVKMPDSFAAGVARLDELHKKIHHQIEHNELKHVHRTAEEMALVAQKTKELAQKTVAEDKLSDAGRLLNEVAGYYKPIDEAADAGKKSETEAIYKKMGEAIAKLKEVAK